MEQYQDDDYMVDQLNYSDSSDDEDENVKQASTAALGGDDNDDDDNDVAGDDDLGIALTEHDSHQYRQSQDDFHQEVLSQDDIVKHMCDIIREVTSVIQIPATTARILLNHFKWDREKLMEAYYDSTDLDKLFRDAHVVRPPLPIDHRQNSSGASTSLAKYASYSQHQESITDCKKVTSVGRQSGMTTRSSTSTYGSEHLCMICLMPLPTELMTGLECGHKFCEKCWVQYLTTKVMDEGMGQTISCAAYDCDILVDDATVMRLVMDKRVRSRYQHIITNSFVECNRLLRWCPSPDCSNAIKVQYADTRPVTCKCGLTFCFTCGHDWHDPVKCRILKLWIKKCSDDSETSNWIAANTKECPKCHITIEKDGGCNHMTCKSQTCKWEFCWVCLGPWVPHGSTWYSCNRFDDALAKAARDAQQRSRAALQRYLHYCNRYMNHMQSLKFENKLYATAKTKMEQMQQHNMSWIEVQFLRKAIDVLCSCRRTLMYTYVFAYYLTKNNQSIIFEDNQQDLEIATEQLSEFLERDMDKENLATLKQKVQDKYRYCENRRKVMLDHCHEGDEKDWWIFTS